MSNRVYIYYLEYPEKNVSYIGSTRRPSQRQSNHRQYKGKDIKLHIIDECTINDRLYWEHFYDSLFKSWGFKLKNRDRAKNTKNIIWYDRVHSAVGYERGLIDAQKMFTKMCNKYIFSPKTSQEWAECSRRLDFEFRQLLRPIINRGLYEKKQKRIA